MIIFFKLVNELNIESIKKKKKERKDGVFILVVVEKEIYDYWKMK